MATRAGESGVGEVLGIGHVDLRVGDLARSTRFSGEVLGALGFSRVEHPSYVAWSNGRMSVGLRPRDGTDPATGGSLHHIAFRAKARADVDALHELLRERGHAVLDAPAEYPQYGPRYYAVFFADPDANKLELVHFPWGYWRRVQEDGADARPRYTRDR